MKRIIPSLAFILTLFCCQAFAQNIAPTWTAIYSGTGDNSDRFNQIISDGAGNFIGVGYTIKPDNYRDFLTVKFDSTGDTLWWRTKNGSNNGDDEAVAVDIDGSGNVFVTGYADAGVAQNNILTIKYDASGTVLWDTTWDSRASLDDEGVDLVIDDNGNCIVGGNAEPDTFAGSSDFITIKYNTNGGVIWDTTYSNPGVSNEKDALAAVALDSIDNVYVTGRSVGGGLNDDFILIKYSVDSGIPMWIQPYNAGFDDRAVDMVVDNSEFVIITGSSDDGSSINYRTNKYSSGGLLQWTRTTAGPAGGTDVPVAVRVDASDNVYVTGYGDIDPTALSNYNFMTAKSSS